MATHEVSTRRRRCATTTSSTADRALQEALRTRGRRLGGGARARCSAASAGSSEADRAGACRRMPRRRELRTHDRYGHRIDEVEYHPAYHELMRARGRPRPARAAVARAAPRRARGARGAVLRPGAGRGRPRLPDLHDLLGGAGAARRARRWRASGSRACSRRTTIRACRPAAEKTGALCGMAMTEKQGGSDVRANTTRAAPGRRRAAGVLTGHKWFCSAPMCDAFLVLAQTPNGAVVLPAAALAARRHAQPRSSSSA